MKQLWSLARMGSGRTVRQGMPGIEGLAQAKLRESLVKFVNGISGSFAKREGKGGWPMRLGPPVAVGLLLGLLGPFGTYDAIAVLPRLVYWLSVVSLNWLLCDLAIRQIDTRLSESLPGRHLLVPLGGSFLVSLPATAVVHMASSIAGVARDSNLLELYGKVLLLCAVISVVGYRASRRESDDKAGLAPVAGQRIGDREAPLFFARLSKPLRGKLLCLEMQDHYLAVHSSEGSELILCRMEDAARELDGLGQRVHRSWWVARDALSGVERSGQQQLLRLTDGRLVPVGRTYRTRLRECGFL